MVPTIQDANIRRRKKQLHKNLAKNGWRMMILIKSILIR